MRSEIGVLRTTFVSNLRVYAISKLSTKSINFFQELILLIAKIYRKYNRKDEKIVFIDQKSNVA